MTAFVTHPSVRIRGTENDYEPVICVFPSCADKPPHMHCPFCVKTEVFQDHAILKAHFRVKHVDKGLEFAGLRILRCCDHCDIVGTIKGEKKFKGPHWHCYKCRNGFNRRDEAIKHYRTHFRNPQTTFQIQVTQEVNVMLHNMNHTGEGQDGVDGVMSEPSTEYTVQQGPGAPGSLAGAETTSSSQASVLDGYYTSPGSDVPSKHGGAIVAANETIDSTVADSSSQAILIVDDRNSGDSYAVTPGTVLNGDQIHAYEEMLRSKVHLEKQVNDLKARVAELEAQLALLQQQQSEPLPFKMESPSDSDLASAHGGDASNEHANGRSSTLKLGDSERLVERLQRQHRELLVAQLEELRTNRVCCPSCADDDDDCPSAFKRRKVS